MNSETYKDFSFDRKGQQRPSRPKLLKLTDVAIPNRNRKKTKVKTKERSQSNARIYDDPAYTDDISHLAIPIRRASIPEKIETLSLPHKRKGHKEKQRVEAGRYQLRDRSSSSDSILSDSIKHKRGQSLERTSITDRSPKKREKRDRSAKQKRNLSLDNTLTNSLARSIDKSKDISFKTNVTERETSNRDKSHRRQNNSDGWRISGQIKTPISDTSKQMENEENFSRRPHLTKLQIGKRFLKGEIGIKSFNYYLLKEGLKSSKKFVDKQRSSLSKSGESKKQYSKSEENIYEEIFFIDKNSDSDPAATPDEPTIDPHLYPDCELCVQQQCTKENCEICLDDLEKFTFSGRNQDYYNRGREKATAPGTSRAGSFIKRGTESSADIIDTAKSQRAAANILQFQSYNPNNPGVYKIETTPVAFTSDYNPIHQLQQQKQNTQSNYQQTHHQPQQPAFRRNSRTQSAGVGGNPLGGAVSTGRINTKSSSSSDSLHHKYAKHRGSQDFYECPQPISYISHHNSSNTQNPSLSGGVGGSGPGLYDQKIYKSDSRVSILSEYSIRSESSNRKFRCGEVSDSSLGDSMFSAYSTSNQRRYFGSSESCRFGFECRRCSLDGDKCSFSDTCRYECRNCDCSSSYFSSDFDDLNHQANTARKSNTARPSNRAAFKSYEYYNDNVDVKQNKYAQDFIKHVNDVKRSIYQAELQRTTLPANVVYGTIPPPRQIIENMRKSMKTHYQQSTMILAQAYRDQIKPGLNSGGNGSPYKQRTSRTKTTVDTSHYATPSMMKDDNEARADKKNAGKNFLPATLPLSSKQSQNINRTTIDLRNSNLEKAPLQKNVATGTTTGSISICASSEKNNTKNHPQQQQTQKKEATGDVLNKNPSKPLGDTKNSSLNRNSKRQTGAIPKSTSSSTGTTSSSSSSKVPRSNKTKASANLDLNPVHSRGTLNSNRDSYPTISSDEKNRNICSSAETKSAGEINSNRQLNSEKHTKGPSAETQPVIVVKDKDKFRQNALACERKTCINSTGYGNDDVNQKVDTKNLPSDNDIGDVNTKQLSVAIEIPLTPSFIKAPVMKKENLDGGKNPEDNSKEPLKKYEHAKQIPSEDNGEHGTQQKLLKISPICCSTDDEDDEVFIDAKSEIVQDSEKIEEKGTVCAGSKNRKRYLALPATPNTGENTPTAESKSMKELTLSEQNKQVENQDEIPKINAIPPKPEPQNLEIPSQSPCNVIASRKPSMSKSTSSERQSSTENPKTELPQHAKKNVRKSEISSNESSCVEVEKHSSTAENAQRAEISCTDSAGEQIPQNDEKCKENLSVKASVNACAQPVTSIKAESVALEELDGVVRLEVDSTSSTNAVNSTKLIVYDIAADANTSLEIIKANPAVRSIEATLKAASTTTRTDDVSSFTIIQSADADDFSRDLDVAGVTINREEPKVLRKQQLGTNSQDEGTTSWFDTSEATSTDDQLTTRSSISTDRIDISDLPLPEIPPKKRRSKLKEHRRSERTQNDALSIPRTKERIYAEPKIRQSLASSSQETLEEPEMHYHHGVGPSGSSGTSVMPTYLFGENLISGGSNPNSNTTDEIYLNKSGWVQVSSKRFNDENSPGVYNRKCSQDTVPPNGRNTIRVIQVDKTGRSTEDKSVYAVPRIANSKIEELISRSELRRSAAQPKTYMRPGYKILDPQIASILNERPGFLPVKTYMDIDSPPPITPILSPPPAFQDSKGKYRSIDNKIASVRVVGPRPSKDSNQTTTGSTKGMVFSRSFEYDTRKPASDYADTFSKSFDCNLSETRPSALRDRSPNFATLTGSSPNYLTKKEHSRDNSPKYTQSNYLSPTSSGIVNEPPSYANPKKLEKYGRSSLDRNGVERSRRAQFSRVQQSKPSSAFRSFESSISQRLNSCDSGARSDLSNDEIDEDDEKSSGQFLSANYQSGSTSFNRNQQSLTKQRSLTPDKYDSGSYQSSLRKQRSLTPERRSLTPEERRKKGSQISLGARQNSGSRTNTLERNKKYEEKSLSVSRSSSSSSYSGGEHHDATIGPRRSNLRNSKSNDEHRIRRSRSLQLTERSPNRTTSSQHKILLNVGGTGGNGGHAQLPSQTIYHQPQRNNFPSVIPNRMLNEPSINTNRSYRPTTDIDKSRSFDLDFSPYHSQNNSNRLDFDKSRSFDEDYRDQNNKIRYLPEISGISLKPNLQRTTKIPRQTSPQNYGTRLCDHELTYDMLRRTLDRSPIMDFSRDHGSLRSRDKHHLTGSELNFLKERIYDRPILCDKSPGSIVNYSSDRLLHLDSLTPESEIKSYASDYIYRPGSDAAARSSQHHHRSSSQQVPGPTAPTIGSCQTTTTTPHSVSICDFWPDCNYLCQIQNSNKYINTDNSHIYTKNNKKRCCAIVNKSADGEKYDNKSQNPCSKSLKNSNTVIENLSEDKNRRQYQSRSGKKYNVRAKRSVSKAQLECQETVDIAGPNVQAKPPLYASKSLASTIVFLGEREMPITRDRDLSSSPASSAGHRSTSDRRDNGSGCGSRQIQLDISPSGSGGDRSPRSTSSRLPLTPSKLYIFRREQSESLPNLYLQTQIPSSDVLLDDNNLQDVFSPINLSNQMRAVSSPSLSENFIDPKGPDENRQTQQQPTVESQVNTNWPSNSPSETVATTVHNYAGVLQKFKKTFTHFKGPNRSQSSVQTNQIICRNSVNVANQSKFDIISANSNNVGKVTQQTTVMVDNEATKHRFGPLIWRSSKERRKTKHNRRDKCNSGDSGIQIELDNDDPFLETMENSPPLQQQKNLRVRRVNSAKAGNSLTLCSTAKSKSLRKNENFDQKITATPIPTRSLSQPSGLDRMPKGDLDDSETDSASSRPDLDQAARSNVPIYAEVLYPFQPIGPQELALERGNLIEILKKDTGPWWLGRIKNDAIVEQVIKPQKGWFPKDFVRILSSASSSATKITKTNTATSSSSFRLEAIEKIIKRDRIDDEENSSSSSNSNNKMQPTIKPGINQTLAATAQNYCDNRLSNLSSIPNDNSNFPSGSNSSPKQQQQNFYSKNLIVGLGNVSPAIKTINHSSPSQKHKQPHQQLHHEGHQQELTKNLQQHQQQNCEALRSSVIKELLETEINYVKLLSSLCFGYLMELRKRVDIFSKESLNLIFSNIESIWKFQQNFLDALRKGIENHRIAQVFLEYQSGFIVYSTYCNSYPRALMELESYSGSKDAKRVLENCRIAENLPELPLSAHLLAPIQRICRYPLHLSELVKHTQPRQHTAAVPIQINASEENYIPASYTIEEQQNYKFGQDAADCKEILEYALASMKKVTEMVNEGKRHSENLTRFQTSFENFQGPPIAFHSTRFFMQTDATRVTPNLWNNTYTLFLFDHQLIYCKKDLLKRNHFIYKGRIFLDSCRILNLPDGKMFGVTLKNALRIYCESRHKWFDFCFRSASRKLRFLSTLAAERQFCGTSLFVSELAGEDDEHLSDREYHSDYDTPANTMQRYSSGPTTDSLNQMNLNWKESIYEGDKQLSIETVMHKYSDTLPKKSRKVAKENGGGITGTTTTVAYEYNTGSLGRRKIGSWFRKAKSTNNTPTQSPTHHPLMIFNSDSSSQSSPSLGYIKVQPSNSTKKVSDSNNKDTSEGGTIITSSS